MNKFEQDSSPGHIMSLLGVGGSSVHSGLMSRMGVPVQECSIHHG